MSILPKGWLAATATLSLLVAASIGVAAWPVADAYPATLASAPGDGPSFDLQAHRGGIALTAESTLPAFARAMRLGVTTLELDVQITEDGQAVVTHDRVVNESKCRDTAPVHPGDPAWPYVGDYVKDLTLAQVRTLDCGSLTLPEFPAQVPAPGARMPLLSEVFALVDRYRAEDLKLNVETKVEAGAPEETAPRGQFVRVVAAEVRSAGMTDQVTVQSFDWGALMLMRELAPELPIVALTNGDFLEVGQPGASPWLGGLDIDDFGGDLVAAAASFGADAISPVQGTPQDGSVNDTDFVPYVTRAMVRRAHAAGMLVIPWTVDDRDTMEYFMDRGVDGLITDRPDVLRDVMAERGLDLPPAYRDPAARSVTPLEQAHAHNDYEHERPLLDALQQGFTSVEADVYLVDGELLVAHDRVDLDPSRTLESLYLDPLERRIARHDGAVYDDWTGSLQLLVDIKTAARPTYRAVSRELREHRPILTRFAPNLRHRAVEVVISGERPLLRMTRQRHRFAGYDGRLLDLASGRPASLMPLVSDNWDETFTWQGVGPMPTDELSKLQSIVRRAHANGYRLRFWETPDEPGLARATVWAVLVDNGVDHVNTDDLTGLKRFLLNRGVAD